jgi:hypothetical protein
MSVTSKRVSAELRAVAHGALDFSRLENLPAISEEETGRRIVGHKADAGGISG